MYCFNALSWKISIFFFFSILFFYFHKHQDESVELRKECVCQGGRRKIHIVCTACLHACMLRACEVRPTPAGGEEEESIERTNGTEYSTILLVMNKIGYVPKLNGTRVARGGSHCINNNTCCGTVHRGEY